MKATTLFAALPALALTIAACGSTPAATTPAATRAPATSAPTAPPTVAPTAAGVVYKATLTPANQNPPITSPESSCRGDVTITVTGAQAKFDVNVTACPATTAINIGHIHEGAAGVNGPVKVDTTLKAGELALTAGAGKLSRTAPIDAAIASAIAANPAGYYFNMHSTLHAGGVLRGQLTKG